MLNNFVFVGYKVKQNCKKHILKGNGLMTWIAYAFSGTSSYASLYTL